MKDEGTLRERYPEIPWDQPVPITVMGESGTSLFRFVCRYCVAMVGLRASKIHEVGFAFVSRAEALDHIERVHHSP